MAFHFPDVQTLRLLAGPSGARGGRAAPVGDGWIVEFDPAPSAEGWAAQGVAPAVLPDDARRILHWAELLPLEPDPEPDAREVVFLLAPGEPWAPVAAELLRLGCADQAVKATPHGWAIRAHAPSYYTIAGSLDRRRQVLVRQLPQLWVPWGARHPMAAELTIPAGASLWLGAPWQVVDENGWVDVIVQVDLDLPEDAEPAAAPTERLRVALRLTRAAATPAPSLWLADRALVERLTWTLPEAEIERLEFAAFDDGTIALRARPGAGASLDLPRAFYEHPLAPAVWVAGGHAIEPPLRAATLRQALTPGPGRMAWIEAREGRLVRSVAPERAFHPLRDWVLYEADRASEPLAAWMGTALFEWTIPDLPSDPAPTAQRWTGGRAGVERVPTTARAAPAPRAPIVAAPVPAPAIDLGPAPAEPSDVQRELLALQDAWRADPSRADLWPAMAVRYGALGRDQDAALCWARAVWEDPAALWDWQRAWEVPAQASEQRVLIGRCVAILAGEPNRRARQWVAGREHLLDVRTRWLVERTLARRDGDRLALARARDAVLGALRSGLVPSRDLPEFLRVSASTEERAALEASLSALRAAVHRLAPATMPVPTRVYAHFTLAWAQVSLGFDPGPLDDAPPADPLHQALHWLYRARIAQARIGLPPEASPPADVEDRIASLGRFDAFKLARLRERSVLLAQPGQSSPFAAWVSEPAEPIPADRLEAAVEGWLSGGPNPDAIRRALGALSALPSAGASLRRAIALAAQCPPESRVALLEEALSVAAATRASDVVEGVLEPLRVGLAAILDQPNELESALRELPRNLARLRATEPGRALFEGLLAGLPAGSTLPRVLLEGSVAQCGGDSEAALSAALAAVASPLQPAERVALACATARLAAGAPVRRAVAAWAALAAHGPSLVDQFSTNSHFALSFLRLIDAIAAAHVHPDRLLGPEDWARLEAEEHAVRVRIHEESRW